MNTSMHRIIALLVLLVLNVGLWSCRESGSGVQKKQSESSRGISSSAASGGAAVYLNGAYATTGSERLNALFDPSKGGHWRSESGAGPDEGIMLYFREPTALSALQLDPLEGSARVPVTIYENGKPGAEGPMGEPLSLSDEPLQSLYIRFGNVADTRTTKRKEGNTEIAIAAFPESAFVGLEKLRLTHQKGQELRLVAPERRKGTVRASSTLNPQNAYGTVHLFDSRKEFAWVEGNESDGTGEYLEFEFVQPVSISSIEIRNGYQRSDEHFAANGRVRSMELNMDGVGAGVYNLKDLQAPQTIQPDKPLNGRKLRLTVNSIYPGGSYKDLAISELLFFDQDQPFKLEAGSGSVDMTDKVAGSPLASLLNRRIANRLVDQDDQVDQSIILRSDGTFVLYRNEVWFDGAENQQLADGNWQLISASPEEARVKVFGKMTDLAQYEAFYRGLVSENFTRIFSDELIIGRRKIEGKRFVQTYYLE